LFNGTEKGAPRKDYKEQNPRQQHYSVEEEGNGKSSPDEECNGTYDGLDGREKETKKRERS